MGEEALQATTVHPANGVRLIKRHMGTEFPIMVGGQEHTPESISALILRQIVAAAPGGLAAKPRAVITVPAYFGLAEREATYQAGVIAGLEVLELLDEPVAAAAHYGLTAAGDRTVLVYDLGGGTFDTTVLRITGGAVTVLATDGHHSLGGADVDQRLLDVVLGRLEDPSPVTRSMSSQTTGHCSAASCSTWRLPSGTQLPNVARRHRANRHRPDLGDAQPRRPRSRVR